MRCSRYGARKRNRDSTGSILVPSQGSIHQKKVSPTRDYACRLLTLNCVKGIVASRFSQMRCSLYAWRQTSWMAAYLYPRKRKPPTFLKLSLHSHKFSVSLPLATLSGGRESGTRTTGTHSSSSWVHWQPSMNIWKRRSSPYFATTYSFWGVPTTAMGPGDRLLYPKV